MYIIQDLLTLILQNKGIIHLFTNSLYDCLTIIIGTVFCLSSLFYLDMKQGQNVIVVFILYKYLWLQYIQTQYRLTRIKLVVIKRVKLRLTIFRPVLLISHHWSIKIKQPASPLMYKIFSCLGSIGSLWIVSIVLLRLSRVYLNTVHWF